MTNTCAIYCRVSTDSQRERNTIESQKRILPEYAAKQGWEIFNTYVDDGFSGETWKGRPDFCNLLSDTENKKFNIVLVIDQDRISRSSSEMDKAFIYDVLRENNIKIATPETIIDLKNEDQNLLAGIKAQLAAWEKVKITKRMKRGKIEKNHQGKFSAGSLAYGFKLDGEKRIILDDRKAEIIKNKMVKPYLEGDISIRSLAVSLTEQGIPSPRNRRWSETAVREIFRNTCYCGEYPVRKYKYEGSKKIGLKKKEENIILPAPKIISKETWQQLQDKMNNRKWDKPLSDETKNHFLLRNMITCGECGAKMLHFYGQKRKDETRPTYYACFWRG